MFFNDFRGPLGTKKGAKIGFKFNVKTDLGPGALQRSIWRPFWTLLGSIWGVFWDDLVTNQVILGQCWHHFQ